MAPVSSLVTIHFPSGENATPWTSSSGVWLSGSGPAGRPVAASHSRIVFCRADATSLPSGEKAGGVAAQPSAV